MIFFEKTLSFFGLLTTYILMFIFNPGHTWSEIESCKLLNNVSSQKTNVIKQNRKKYFKYAVKMQKNEQMRILSNNKKCQTLLNISSFLFAAQIALFSWKSPSLYSCIPPILTAGSIFLILMRDKISSFMVLDPMQYIKKKINKSSLLKKLIRDMIIIIKDDESINNYKIGIYTAARRMLLLSILTTIFLSIWLYTQNKPEQSQSKSIPINMVDSNQFTQK